MKPILLALQYYPKDEAQANELASFIAETTSRQQSEGYDFALCPRIDSRVNLAVFNALQMKFPKVLIIQGKKHTTGWPAGPNGLWIDVMQYILLRARQHDREWSGVFTFEPDCVPTHKEWLAIIRGAWSVAQANGHLAMGDVQPDSLPEETPEEHRRIAKGCHMNGNGIFDARFLDLFPEMQYPTLDSWDTHWAHLIVPHAKNCPHIVSRYHTRQLQMLDLIARKEEGKPIAFFHGCKDGSALKLAREIMK